MTLTESINSIVANVVVALVGIAATWLLAEVRKRVRSKLAADALSLLAHHAMTLVAATADEVRKLKDPTKPGEWSPAVAAAIKARVVSEIKRSAAHSLEQLRTVERLDAAGAERLLEQLVESEVERQRALRGGA